MRPLDGVLVVEVGDLVAAQYCGMLLASLGARVVRIEDPRRPAGPPGCEYLPGSIGTEGSFRHLHLMPGKERASLAYSSPRGYALLRQLLAKATVFLEGLGPEQAAGCGLEFENLRGISTELITASLSWFGHTGPYRSFRATDLTSSALSGYLYLNGQPSQPPINLPLPLGEYLAGLSAAIGICALLLSAPDGDARYLDVSVQESLAIQLAGAATDAVRTGTNARRAGNRMVARNGGRTYTGVLPCADGYMVVAVVGEADYRRLADLDFAVDSLPLDARTMPGNFPEEIDQLLTPWLATRSRSDITGIAQAAGLHWSEVAGPAEAMTTDQACVRHALGHYDHPLFGPVPFVQVPLGAGSAGWAEAPAFRLRGVDTEAVLTADLGLSRPQIRALVSNGVI